MGLLFLALAVGRRMGQESPARADPSLAMMGQRRCCSWTHPTNLVHIAPFHDENTRHR